jgi:2-polyprenyl-6-methoxyphenol hydroxylase-like FAD-dependent oxidoreductase
MSKVAIIGGGPVGLFVAIRLDKTKKLLYLKVEIILENRYY